MAKSSNFPRFSPLPLLPLSLHSYPDPVLLVDRGTNMDNGASSEGKDPSAFLSEIIGAPVIVKLNSGVVYKGNLYLLFSWISPFLISK